LFPGTKKNRNPFGKTFIPKNNFSIFLFPGNWNRNKKQKKVISCFWEQFLEISQFSFFFFFYSSLLLWPPPIARSHRQLPAAIARRRYRSPTTGAAHCCCRCCPSSL